MPRLDRVTDRWLRAVTTEKVQEEYWDVSRPGLYVRVSRGGTRSFFFSYYSPIDRRKRSLLLGKFNPEGAKGAQLAWSIPDPSVVQGEEKVRALLQTGSRRSDHRLDAAGWLGSDRSGGGLW